jgi:hypothetical protein
MGSLPMPNVLSRLAQLRADRKVILGCTAGAIVLVGAPAISTIVTRQQTIETQATTDRRNHAAAATQESIDRAESARKIAIDLNAQGWKSWQAHIDPRCHITVTKLATVYRGQKTTFGKPLKAGDIVCDRDRVAILKGADLVPRWAVPRLTSSYPMPTTAPPPEFRLPPPVETINQGETP